MRRPKHEPHPPTSEVTIKRLGTAGDGIALLGDGTLLYVPGALPGEVVRARPVARRGEGWAAELVALLRPVPERVAAPCPHFGQCGGCALQHWHGDAYADWKAGLLRHALGRAGFADAPVGPVCRCQPANRRRLDLALRRTPAGVTAGLHRQRSTDIVDLETCLVAAPALFSLLRPFRVLLQGLDALNRNGSAELNLTETGPDLLLRTDAALSVGDRMALAGFAHVQDIARISWALKRDPPEPVCVRRQPIATFADVPVHLPPGAFLQATADGEAAIVSAVIAGLPAVQGRARIVELFAGCGTLTFPLALHGHVTAYEGNEAAFQALRRAAACRPVHAIQRDLARSPLQTAELAGACAIVLDPPYTGAAGQMPALAATKAGRIIYVSCSQAALCRDARVLKAAGYKIAAATAIDQFLWSPQLECVVVFSL